MAHFNPPFLSLPVGTAAPEALGVFIEMNTTPVPLDTHDMIVARFEGRTGKSMHDLLSDLKKVVSEISSLITPEHVALQTAALRAGVFPRDRALQRALKSR